MDLGPDPTDRDDIIQRYGRRLFVLAYHLTGDATEAEELSHECLVRGLLAPDFPSSDTEAGVSLHRGLISLWKERMEAPGSGAVLRVAGGTEGAETGRAAREHAGLWRALSRLDPVSRAVLVLRVAGGLEYETIGKVLDMAPDIVYARLLQARAESNGFFSAFYKVRNRIQSYWDSDGGFTRRYVENRREGGFRAKDQIEFDYDKLEARYQDGRSYPIPPHVQDALSSFYFARMQSLPLGGSFVFDYHASRKSQPLEVRVLGRERVETPAGKFNCVAIEPKLKAGGIFKNKGQLVIWITEDERRMPVLMRSKVTIGSISVVLQEYKAGT